METWEEIKEKIGTKKQRGDIQNAAKLANVSYPNYFSAIKKNSLDELHDCERRIIDKLIFIINKRTRAINRLAENSKSM